jgi:hypothetical protein
MEHSFGNKNIFRVKVEDFTEFFEAELVKKYTPGI